MVLGDLKAFFFKAWGPFQGIHKVKAIFKVILFAFFTVVTSVGRAQKLSEKTSTAGAAVWILALVPPWAGSHCIFQAFEVEKGYASVNEECPSCNSKND